MPFIKDNKPEGRYFDRIKMISIRHSKSFLCDFSIVFSITCVANTDYRL